MNKHIRFMYIFGQQLKQARNKINMTQEDVVILLRNEKFQISQSYLSLLEAGQRTEPSLKIIITLAAIFKISLDAILEEVGE